MQERPDPRAVLEALGRFLLEELHPTVSDKRLAFRVLIAAHLASTLAGELEQRPGQASRELERLRALLPGVDLPEGDTRSALRRLNAVLGERLASGDGPPDERALRDHLRSTLADALRVLSPRFDLASDIEG